LKYEEETEGEREGAMSVLISQMVRNPRIDPQPGDEARFGGLIRQVVRREGRMLWCHSGGLPYRMKLLLWQKASRETLERLSGVQNADPGAAFSPRARTIGRTRK